MKNCISGLCTGPFNSHFTSLARVSTGPRQGYRLQKTSFRFLVGIYYHNIPTHTPQSGLHGVTEVAKTANIAKMAEKYMNCTSARPTLPHTNPMESGHGNTFSAQNRKKTKRLMIFDPKKGGCHFWTPPQLPQNLKKVGFKWGGF